MSPPTACGSRGPASVPRPGTHHRGPGRLSLGVGLVAAAMLAGCSPPPTPPAATPAPATPSVGTLAPPTPTPTPTPTPARPVVRPGDYFPLTPGQRFTYVGTITDDEGVHTHTVTATVTDLVKTIGPTDARVLLDIDETDGEVTESELAFLVQDADGNTWTYAEYPEEFDEGRFAGAPSTWVTGQRRASAGILVPGTPAIGEQFSQGKAPTVGFDDEAVVEEAGLHHCVTLGCFDDVIRVREWAPKAPGDGYQLKFYAPRVGLVDVRADGGDSQEAMDLVKVDTLSPAEMDEVRARAVTMDERGRRTHRDLRATPPVRQG